MIPHSIALTSQKGGSGKSSISANLAHLAAASGWRVLLVDLDPQGNLAREFGYMEQSDGGRGLLNAFVADQPLEPLRGVRTNLDVVAGGPSTRRLLNWLSSEAHEDPSVLRRLDDVLAPLGHEKDLLVFDTPPGDYLVHSLLSSTVHFFVTPTQGDRASSDGIGDVLLRIATAREGNPPLNSQLELLGVVVTFVPSGAKAIDRRIREDLRGLLGDEVKIFEPSIRYAKQAAMDVRERGLSVIEYENLSVTSKEAMPWHEALKKGLPVVRFSSAAGGLAGDYQRLVNEILVAFSERQRELGYLA